MAPQMFRGCHWRVASPLHKGRPAVEGAHGAVGARRQTASNQEPGAVARISSERTLCRRLSSTFRREPLRHASGIPEGVSALLRPGQYIACGSVSGARRRARVRCSGYFERTLLMHPGAGAKRLRQGARRQTSCGRTLSISAGDWGRSQPEIHRDRYSRVPAPSLTLSDSITGEPVTKARRLLHTACLRVPLPIDFSRPGNRVRRSALIRR